MKKYRNLLAIIIGVIICASIISVFYFKATNINEQKNGFIRNLNTNKLQQLVKLKNDHNFQEICGIGNNGIYLANKIPGDIYLTDFSVSNVRFINLPVPKYANVASLFNTSVSDTSAFVFAYNAPGIFHIGLHSAIPTFYHMPVLFDHGSLYNGIIYLIGIDRTFQKRFFVIIHPDKDTSELIKQFPDNIPSFEGSLSYDDSTNSILYVSFYSNLFLCFDQTLKLKYIGHTIDTITLKPRTQSAIVKKHSTYITHKGPSKILNRPGCAARGLLFVNSTLKADNETYNSFRDNSVIDVYKTTDGTYLRSFYVPLDRGDHFKRFLVFEQYLVAVYPHDVVVFKMPF